MKKDELEKEAQEKYNERLKQNGCNIEYRNETYIDGYLDSAEPREERIADLENRNQELLESCEGATMMYKDLQKSKEIIKKLLHTLENKDSEYTFALKPTHPVLVEAEQFIKEGEKKDESRNG